MFVIYVNQMTLSFAHVLHYYLLYVLHYCLLYMHTSYSQLYQRIVKICKVHTHNVNVTNQVMHCMRKLLV